MLQAGHLLAGPETGPTSQRDRKALLGASLPSADWATRRLFESVGEHGQKLVDDRVRRLVAWSVGDDGVRARHDKVGETHEVAGNGCMSLMFMSITDKPLILRIYGTANVIHPRNPEWDELIGLFPKMGGSRQIFDLAIESTSSSCGSRVPVMTVNAVRGDEALEPHYAAMTDEELHSYWDRKNVTSIDGYPTNIFEG